VKPLVKLRILFSLSEVALDLRIRGTESVRHESPQLVSVAQLVCEVRKLRVEEDVPKASWRVERDAIGADHPRLRPPAESRHAQRVDPPAQAL
jgi:hypothetical protein